MGVMGQIIEVHDYIEIGMGFIRYYFRPISCITAIRKSLVTFPMIMPVDNLDECHIRPAY